MRKRNVVQPFLIHILNLLKKTMPKRALASLLALQFLRQGLVSTEIGHPCYAERIWF